MSFVHLHTHSHYSLLDGLSKIPDLVEKTKDLGQKAVALTDHGVMYGAIEFYKKCQEAGIKPIIGCEVYVAPRAMNQKEPGIDNKYHHLTLLAKDIVGYRNLIRIVSQAHLRGFYYKPRADKRYIAKHAEGLIALSGCPGGELSQLSKTGNIEKVKKVALDWQNIFGKTNYYIEIQPHQHIKEIRKMTEVLRKVSEEASIPLVATNDSHYLNKEDREAHEILLKINTSHQGKEDSGMSLKDFDLYLLSEKEMRQRLPNDKEAINNTAKIASRINLQLEFGKSILPEFPLPKSAQGSRSYLRKLVAKGFKKRYKDDKTAKERLSYELGVINKTGFSDYFLIVSDLVNWAKRNGIYVGPGRGSAAGSIVSYCLNITSIDPLKYNLIFERFLNPDRISMPDIDMDFADDRRHEVVDYIVRRYGKTHVCQIITFGVMKSRMVVRDVARALDFPYEVGDEIAKTIPMGTDLATAMKMVPDFGKLYETREDIKKVVDMSFKLENVARHASTHAAGVVVSKEPLVNYIPLQRATGSDDSASTQYPMQDVEAIGLLKLDILGLKNLTIMKNAVRIIRKVYSEEIDIENLPLEDEKTFRLLREGRTVGVFQLESSGMQRYLKELKPTEIEDIISMVALYRPGPMESIATFIDAKHGRKNIEYLHPSLKPILEPTYGVIVTQDQVLQIAREFAGFTYGEADILRKAVGKKIKKLLTEQKKKFIMGAVKTQNVSQELAQKVWNFIEPFARYGFNRAHATCYAMIAYQTAYLKANYPDAFMAAVLTSESHNLDKVAVAISEAESLGIEVLPPDINESFEEFGVLRKGDKKICRFGLGAIKNVGDKAAQIIVRERKDNGPYKNLEDFLDRLPSSLINKKVLESLIKSGALEKFGERNRLLAGIPEILKYSQGGEKAQAQPDMFRTKGMSVEKMTIKLPNVQPASKKQRLNWERELLSIYISEHPLKEYSHVIDEIGYGIATINEGRLSKNAELVGVVSRVKNITTKNGEAMAFVTMEDFTGSIEVVVFPSIYKETKNLWITDNLLKLAGKISRKDSQIKILINRADDLSEVATPFSKKQKQPQHSVRSAEEGLKVFLTGNQQAESLSALKKILAKYPGKQPVYLRFKQNGQTREVLTVARIDPCKKLLNELKDLLGKESISG